MKCSFPNCVMNAQPNGFCIGHQAFANFKNVTVSKPASKKSDVRKEEEKLYKKIVKQMAAISNKCDIKSPVCTKIMQGLHHMKKRGINYLNKNFLKRSCNPCNHYIEEHPGWAKQNGHSVSKFKKDNVIIAEHDKEVNATIIQ